MYYIFFDESKFPARDFIIGSFVFCEEDPNTFIANALLKNGFDPLLDEFKSSTSFQQIPKMAEVRKSLQGYLKKCFFGMVVLPHSELKDLGFVSLRALQIFLSKNNIPSGNKIYFDEGIFSNINKAIECVQELNLNNNMFYFEQDSKIIKGIQLADLISHSLSIIFKESFGDLSKKIRVLYKNSGYPDETEVDIGFEIWTTLRYSFLVEKNKIYNEDADQIENFTYSVEPFGLFISQRCSEELAHKMRETFSTVYLGCIH